MKWGIRRYQNKDGTLTPEGRKRLGLDAYDDDHNTDTTLKKGTKATRWVETGRYDEFKDPKLGGSDKAAKKYIDDIKAKEKSRELKYVSIDDIKNSGRENGKDFYMNWFTEDGLSPDMAYLDTYQLKSDVRVASGKKVVDTLLEEVGSEKVGELLKNNGSIKSLTMDYTLDKNLFNKVNQRLADEGYNAIEDINDLDSDMPVIMLNSSKTLGKAVSTQSGREALDEYWRKKNKS